MQYDLDPRLLPPSGASVQCTRCSFVFTAMPSGEVLVPGQGQGGTGPKAGGAPRSAVGTSTQVFGSPYASSTRPGGPSPTTTQVFGAVPMPGGESASDRTPAYGSGTAPPGASAGPPLYDRTPAYGSGTIPASAPGGASGASVGKTQVFGAVPQPSSSPAATQVFGAASVPTKAPAVATTQVFGAASAPSPLPAGAPTQVFGPVSAPAQPPAAPSPLPAASTTQVFGSAAVAAKASSPATTTQVFGAASVTAQAPSPATTQSFGSAAVAAKASSPATTTQVFGAASVLPPAPTPWMAEPGPAPSRPGPSRSAPAIALPEEPAALPGIGLPSFPPEPAVERSGPIMPRRHTAPIELPPEMLVSSPSAGDRSVSEQASGGRGERVLIILAAIVALGLTAVLSYPVWRNQSVELPAEALSTKDQAVSLLRRDDATSRQQAIDMLTIVVAQYPKFTEAQAELVVALSLQLDDVKVELEWLTQEEHRAHRELSALELAKSPADWKSRINARKEELAALGQQKRPLEAAATELTKQLDQLLPTLRAAPETEPSADVVARWKAQAVHESVRGNPQAIALADKLAKLESPPLWSIVTRVEYGLNASSPPAALHELSAELAKVREQDKTFFRAYVLGARLALRQNDLAAAQALLGPVVALNPNHTLALKLQKRAASGAPAP